MKVLLDTNVLVAAFISHGSCQELLEYCFDDHEIVTTRELLGELKDVLSRKFRYSRADVTEALNVLRLIATVVEPAPREKVCRDPDDDRVLAAALGGRADCIVTGDKDLLAIREWRGILILSPDGFWRFAV